MAWIRAVVRFCKQAAVDSISATSTDQLLQFMNLAVALNDTKNTGSSGKPPFEEDDCAYHEHRLNETPCYKTKSGF